MQQSKSVAIARPLQAGQFYRELSKLGVTVRVGMEASGHARWCERLLAELQFELWIGDAAAVRTKRVRKQKTDRQDAQLLLQRCWKIACRASGCRTGRIAICG